MRDKFNRFMQGRYGVDAFARFTMGVALVAIILSIFFRNGSRIGALLDTVGLLVLLYTYYRMLSRDIQKRYQENEKYGFITVIFSGKVSRSLIDIKTSFSVEIFPNVYHFCSSYYRYVPSHTSKRIINCKKYDKCKKIDSDNTLRNRQ